YRRVFTPLDAGAKAKSQHLLPFCFRMGNKATPRFQRQFQRSGEAISDDRDFCSTLAPIGTIMVSRKAPLPARPRCMVTDPQAFGAGKSFGRWSMTFVPVMWTIWAVLVVVTFGFYLYRSRLTRDEEDQIFLDDSFEHE